MFGFSWISDVFSRAVEWFYVSPPSESTLCQKALSGLHAALNNGDTVQQACTDYGREFQNSEFMQEACETMYQGGVPLVPADLGLDLYKVGVVGISACVVALTAGGVVYLYRNRGAGANTVAAPSNDLGKYCPYEGEAGAQLACQDFARDFRVIMQKYQDVQGPLCQADMSNLERTLKSLVKYYFWDDNSEQTEDVMRKKVFHKMSLLFHPDKIDNVDSTDNKALIQPSDLQRYIELVGNVHKPMVFKILADCYAEYPNGVSFLAAALKTHKAATIEPESPGRERVPTV